MGLETATSIAELDDSYPLGGDNPNKGDDHLRLIKAVLKVQFPGALGQGLDVPITANETELNYLIGLSSNAQDQFDAIDTRLDGLEGTVPAPVGTRLAFHQAAAPLGWTQDATIDDSMLRVVSGAGGATGGSDSAIAHTHTTGDHQLTTDEMPSHTHLYARTVTSAARDPSGLGQHTAESSADTGSAGGDAVHNHGATDEFTPKYHDMIVCEKD